MRRLARSGLAGLTVGLVTTVLPALALQPGPSAQAAYPVGDPGSCASGPITPRGSASSPDPDLRADRHPTTTSTTRTTTASPSARSTGTTLTTIRVFVHVLRTSSGGGVGTPRIKRQITILSGAYAGDQSKAAAWSPFRFALADIDRTTNARWYRMDEGTVAETHAKHALHRGNADDLNLYIGMNRSGSLGWGTQPAAYDRERFMDGVVIRRNTMAGGSRGHYSAGDAAVHETGHWLGLLHTFAGRCGSRGDLVADTPREAKPSYTCPVRRNTCAAPGRDPVHNFMDYSYDSCMNQFTAGQVSRMRAQWSVFRAGGG